MSTVPEAARAAFMDAQSCRALTAACLGEASAHRYYLAAARIMEDADLHVIAHALCFTAAQEREHEAIFRGLLAHNGVSAPVPLEEPHQPPRHPMEILERIIFAEADEAERLYPRSAAAADAEGYPRIAAAFRRIAETEDLHLRRFRQYAKALAEGTLFRDEQRLSWLCLGCGQLHAGFEPPHSCSACGSSRGHFIRSSFCPFAVER